MHRLVCAFGVRMPQNKDFSRRMPFHIEYQNLHNDSYAQQKRFGNPRSLFTVFAVHLQNCIATSVLHENKRRSESDQAGRLLFCSLCWFGHVAARI